MRSPNALITLKLLAQSSRWTGAAAWKIFLESFSSSYLPTAPSLSGPSSLTGNNPKVQKSNMTRECIRYFFPVRRCFVFDRPTRDKRLLSQIEKVPEDELEWNFQVESQKFCSYIFTSAKTKTLRGGITVTGSREFFL